MTWGQLSPTLQAVLAEAADDLEVEIWELAAPAKVILVENSRSTVTEPADVDVVRATVCSLLDHGLVALGRRTGNGGLIAQSGDVLDDARAWDPRTVAICSSTRPNRVTTSTTSASSAERP